MRYLLTVIVVAETVFDTFLSSYCHAAEAVLLQMQKGQRSKQIELWTKISGLAYESLADLRCANNSRANWSIADHMAVEAFKKLKER